MTIDLSNGKTLSITSTGGDGNGDTDFYVQSLKVNEQNWTKNWLVWDDVFANGGTLEFVLGPNPVQWATGDLPPSPATEPITCVSFCNQPLLLTLKLKSEQRQLSSKPERCKV
jgi:putative alpha-1,2-mannosidase